MERETYNGWTNYETWNWGLWYMDSFTAEDFEGMEGDPVVIADYLERWTEDLLEAEALDKVGGFFGDILGTAVREVDFRELAEVLIENLELKPEEEEG